VAGVISVAALMALVAAVFLSVLWGSVSDVNCAGLACSDCAADDSCTWCPGPDATSMPGYCEVSTLNSDSTCGQPDAARCVREDVEESRWEVCGAQTEPDGCAVQSVDGGQGCQWCNKTATQLDPSVCVPHDNSSTNASFCDPDGLIFGALRPFALSSRSPACVKNHPTHVDRSNSKYTRVRSLLVMSRTFLTDRLLAITDLGKETARHSQALAVNNSYTEGLTCGKYNLQLLVISRYSLRDCLRLPPVWVIECPFNTSVETRISQVNMGAADSLRVRLELESPFSLFTHFGTHLGFSLSIKLQIGRKELA